MCYVKCLCNYIILRTFIFFTRSNLCIIVYFVCLVPMDLRFPCLRGWVISKQNPQANNHKLTSLHPPQLLLFCLSHEGYVGFWNWKHCYWCLKLRRSSSETWWVSCSLESLHHSLWLWLCYCYKKAQINNKYKGIKQSPQSLLEQVSE